MLATWMLLASAHAAPVEPAMAALEAGDAAWFTGERREGARRWREAIALAGEGPQGRAAEAMARVRLLRASSNWGALVHGPRIDRALAACGRGAWCALAAADFHLLGPVLAGADPEQGLAIARQLRAALPARAASRIALGTGDPAAVLEVDPAERDGLGRAVAAGIVPDPGPWVLAPGVVAGPGTGFGGGLHLAHPDLLRRSVLLQLDGFLATNGFGAGGRLVTPGRVGLVVSAHLARTRWFLEDAWVPVTTAVARPGIAWRPGQVEVQAGPTLRWDDAVSGHGAFLGAAWDRRALDGAVPVGTWLGLSGEAAIPPLARYAGQLGTLDGRGYLALPRGGLAARLVVEGSRGALPEVRRPTLGGTRFRAARPGEVRGDWTIVAQVETRQPLAGPFWGAAFVEGALVEGSGPHAGGGLGIRWVLPQRPLETVRVDVAAGDLGWQVVAGWGEAF